MAKIADLFDDSGFGCLIVYKENIIRCTREKTGQENLSVAIAAISLILGYELTAEQIIVRTGKIEMFWISESQKPDK